jgi:hypothetical protein
MASVKSQTQRSFESDFRLGGRERMELAGGGGGLGPGPLGGPGGPETRFYRRRRLFVIGDQATAGGVSMLRLSLLRLASPRPFLGSSLAVLADIELCLLCIQSHTCAIYNADTRSAGEISPLHALVAAVV